MVLARPFRGLRPREWEDVGHLQPRSAGFDEALDHAAGDLASRVEDGRLELDDEPTATAFWVDDRSPDGGAHRTAGLLVALRVDAGGPDAVLPHEHTFPDPVARRVRTRNRLHVEPTPTLVVLRHPVEAVTTLLAEAMGRPPVLSHADGAGAIHNAVATSLPPEVVRALEGTQALVADGHHRMAAACDPDAADRGTMLAWLVAAEHAPRLHPVHRTVHRLPEDAIGTLARAGIALEGAPATPADGAPVLVTSEGSWAMRVVPGSAAAAALEDLAPPLRELPASLVHHALAGVLGIGTRRDQLGTLIDDRQAVQDVARGRSDAAVLACGPTLDEVWEVASAGHRLPPKATWFAPKPHAGAVLRPLGSGAPPTTDDRQEP